MKATATEFFDVDLSKIGNEDSVGFENKVKLELGVNTIRILPPWRAEALFYKAYKQHFNVIDLRPFGLEVDGWYSEPCLGEVTEVEADVTRVVNKPCPLCKIANKAYSLGQKNKDADLINLGKRLRARKQYAMNVVHKEADASTVKIYVFGKKILDSLRTVFSMHGNITNPISGRSIVVVKKEILGQAYFQYDVLPDDKEDISELWSSTYSAGLHNLDMFPPYSDYEAINAKLEGVHVGETAGYTAGNHSLDELTDPAVERFTSISDPLDA